MSDLRERVARAIYEEKRARLLEAFGDTAGWPEWETLKPTLKEIQMEECDPYIALVLEEAAKVCDVIETMLNDQWRAGYKVCDYTQGASDGANDCAAAIRSLGGKSNA